MDLRSITGGRNYRKFVIVGTARTGSTLLLNLLNGSRHALAFGELFRGDGRIGWDMSPFLSYQSPRLLELAKTRPLEFLSREVFRRRPRRIRAVGFKMFYYHGRTGPQTAVWDWIRDDPNLLIIHIKRQNLLEQYLSLRVAHETNVWSANRSAMEAAPIELDPVACQRHFEELRASAEACDSFFAGGPIEIVTYEELVADKAGVMNRLGARLNLPPAPLQVPIVRQRTRPLTQAIANYDRLVEHFSGSAWEGFFRMRDTAAIGALDS